ncbi:MAG: hypothetical protein HY758_07525 [Nitrospirae bacterium]|nr:hypothetical protein [Nitrospirota bacterium]
MKIESSNLALSATSLSVQQYKKSEDLKVWIGNNGPQPQNDLSSQDDRVTLTDDAKALACNDTPRSDELSIGGDKNGRLLMIKLLIEKITAAAGSWLGRYI